MTVSRIGGRRVLLSATGAYTLLLRSVARSVAF